eukprot:1767662-Rhodomonas_salina.1
MSGLGQSVRTLNKDPPTRERWRAGERWRSTNLARSVVHERGVAFPTSDPSEGGDRHHRIRLHHALAHAHRRPDNWRRVLEHADFNAILDLENISEDRGWHRRLRLGAVQRELESIPARRNGCESEAPEVGSVVPCGVVAAEWLGHCACELSCLRVPIHVDEHCMDLPKHSQLGQCSRAFGKLAVTNTRSRLVRAQERGVHIGGSRCCNHLGLKDGIPARVLDCDANMLWMQAREIRHVPGSAVQQTRRVVSVDRCVQVWQLAQRHSVQVRSEHKHRARHAPRIQLQQVRPGQPGVQLDVQHPSATRTAQLRKALFRHEHIPPPLSRSRPRSASFWALTAVSVPPLLHASRHLMARGCRAISGSTHDFQLQP